MSETWDNILLAIKILGLLVVAASGVIGVLSKTQKTDEVSSEEESGLIRLLEKLNVKGRKLFWTTVFAALITVAAQIAELIKQKNDERRRDDQTKELLTRTELQLAKSDDAFKQTAEQLALAKEAITKLREAETISDQSLGHLKTQSTQIATVITNIEEEDQTAHESLKKMGRLLTRFQSCRVRAFFEIETSNAAFAGLLSDLNTLYTNPITKALFLPEEPDQPTNFPTFLKAQTLFQPNVQGLLKHFEDYRDFLWYVDNPNILIGLFSRKNLTATNDVEMLFPQADLDLGFHSPVQNRQLRYEPATKRIFVEWQWLDFPETNWIGDGEIISVQDLDGALLSYRFFSDLIPGRVHESSGEFAVRSGAFNGMLDSLRPELILLRLDNVSIMLDRDMFPAGKSFAVLPTMAEIMQRNLNIFP